MHCTDFIEEKDQMDTGLDYCINYCRIDEQQALLYTPRAPNTYLLCILTSNMIVHSYGFSVSI